MSLIAVICKYIGILIQSTNGDNNSLTYAKIQIKLIFFKLHSVILHIHINSLCLIAETVSSIISKMSFFQLHTELASSGL